MANKTETSKKDPNGKLPKGWRLARFDEFAQNIAQRVDPAESDADVYVGLEHLDPDSLRIRRFGVPEDVIGQKLQFKTGDIIFGRRRAYQRKLGIAETNGICSAHAMVVRAITDQVDPNYLPFFLQSDMFMERAIAISVGSLSPTINWRTLRTQQFPLPSAEDQKKISRLLLAAEEAIEESINSLEQLHLSRRVVVFQELSKFVALAESDDGVELCDVNDICEQVTDGTHFTPTYVDEGIPFLRVTDIQDASIDWSDVKRIPVQEHVELCKRCRPTRGDVLLSKNGTVGITKVVDWDDEFSIFVSLCLLKPKSHVLPQYLAEVLRSGFAQKQFARRSKQGTVNNLHLVEIRGCKVPIPGLQKQEQFVVACKSFDNALAAAVTRLESLKQLKGNLMASFLQRGV